MKERKIMTPKQYRAKYPDADTYFTPTQRYYQLVLSAVKKQEKAPTWNEFFKTISDEELIHECRSANDTIRKAAILEFRERFKDVIINTK